MSLARIEGWDRAAAGASGASGRASALDVLLAGVLAGIVAGVVATLVAWWAVEPHLEAAIALEEAAAEQVPGHAHEEAPVSRAVQRTVGLAAGTLAVAVAGGLVAGIAGLAARRAGATRGALQSAAWTALGGAFVFGVLPGLAYPANPPGIGSPETSGERTVTYVLLLALGMVAVLGAATVRRLAGVRAGTAAGWVAAGAVLAGTAALASALFTPVEAPDGYPAGLLWEFRRGSLLMHLSLWLAMAGVLAVFARQEAADRRSRDG